MGADTTAMWLGALIVTGLSFVPAIMAPTRRTRHVAGLGARLSLPASLGVAVYSTLSALELTPPPGGVFLSFAYPVLLIAVGLAAWGIGLVASAAAERALGMRIPAILAAVMGLGSIALMLAAK